MTITLDLFRGVIPFVAVAEENSFRRAAIRLGVSAAAISKSVQVLEENLGIALFVRNARSVVLTREGEAFFLQCRDAVAAVDGARDAIDHARRTPTGELVVSAPFVASELLPPAFALMKSRFHRLTFRLLVTDRLSKLAEESVDVAVRIGPSPDASLVMRRLRKTKLVTVAAPSYLARKQAPKRIEDLTSHDCLTLSGPDGKPRSFLFRGGMFATPKTLVTDHAPSLCELALAGLGVTQLFDHMADTHLRSGALVSLLDDEIGTGPEIYAVCAPGRKAAARVRAAFDALADAIAEKR